MDTEFWGKSGWKLCHSIAYSFDPENTSKRMIKLFYKSLQYVLPCVYCRRSFKRFIQMDPIDTTTNRSLTKWIYKIHNYVNDKLRDQGYPIPPNPSIETVDKIYEKNTTDCKKINFDFIYCVAFHYNLDVSETRKKGYFDFFNSLAYVLPNKVNRQIYMDYITQNPIENVLEKVKETESICPLKKWVYKLEKCMIKKCLSYKDQCDKIETYRVDKCTQKTCRKNPRSLNKKLIKN